MFSVSKQGVRRLSDVNMSKQGVRQAVLNVTREHSVRVSCVTRCRESVCISQCEVQCPLCLMTAGCERGRRPPPRPSLSTQSGHRHDSVQRVAAAAAAPGSRYLSRPTVSVDGF